MEDPSLDALRVVVPGYEFLRAASVADERAQGEILLGELNCLSCHGASGPLAAGIAERITTKPAPDLAGIGQRVTPDWLAAYLKDPTDKQWDNSDDMKAWRVWMAKYNPSASLADGFNVYAYAASYTLHKTLEQCGNELTRANLMKQAANLKKLTVPLLLPGITVNTSPTDFYPIQSERLQRFQGETWELFGDVMSNEST